MPTKLCQVSRDLAFSQEALFIVHLDLIPLLKYICINAETTDIKRPTSHQDRYFRGVMRTTFALPILHPTTVEENAGIKKPVHLSLDMERLHAYG